MPSDAVAFDPQPVGTTPRAQRMAERALRTSAEVASMIERVERVKDELARVANGRARHAEVRQHASQALTELSEAQGALVRNCTALRGESIWVERVSARGQELLSVLTGAREDSFDSSYLDAVAQLDLELIDLLEEQVSPRYDSPEAAELTRLRVLLDEHHTRTDTLQRRFAPSEPSAPR